MDGNQGVGDTLGIFARFSPRPAKVQEFLEMCHKLAAAVNGLHAQALENVAAIVSGVSGLKNDAFEPLRAGTAIRGLATVLKVFKASLSAESVSHGHLTMQGVALLSCFQVVSGR